MRHFGQKPSVRPGWPSRLRPTAAPQLAQNRLSSATSGSAMMTERGSGTGADGTEVMPAPRRWDWVRVEPRRRVGRVDAAAGRADRRARNARTVVRCRSRGSRRSVVAGCAAGAPQTLQ